MWKGGGREIQQTQTVFLCMLKPYRGRYRLTNQNAHIKYIKKRLPKGTETQYNISSNHHYIRLHKIIYLYKLHLLLQN